MKRTLQNVYDISRVSSLVLVVNELITTQLCIIYIVSMHRDNTRLMRITVHHIIESVSWKTGVMRVDRRGGWHERTIACCKPAPCTGLPPVVVWSCSLQYSMCVSADHYIQASLWRGTLYGFIESFKRDFLRFYFVRMFCNLALCSSFVTPSMLIT